MIELERRGAVDALHEGGDQRAVGVTDAVGTAAADGLAGQIPLQRIQGAVHVHHQQMQTVAARTVARGDDLDSVGCQLVAARIRNGERLQPLREHGAFRSLGGTKRLQHFGHIRQGVPDDARGIRDAITPLAHPF